MTFVSGLLPGRPEPLCITESSVILTKFCGFCSTTDLLTTADTCTNQA